MNIIINRGYILILLFFLFGCMKTSNKKEIIDNFFNPIQAIEYTAYKVDNNKVNLKIFYSIDSSQFMYVKESNNEYLAQIQLIFQIIDANNKENNRQLLEISISKDNFLDTKRSNYFEGEIDLIIESKECLINMKVIDLQTKTYWTKKQTVDPTSATSYITNLRLYHIDGENNNQIQKKVNKDIQNISCQFQYLNKDEDIQRLNLYLVNKDDTIYNKDIPIISNNNKYDVNIDISNEIQGDIQLIVTDGKESRNRKIYIESHISTDFFSNDINAIRTIMRYVLPYKEYKKVKSMNDDEAVLFLKSYWRDLDPDKETIDNEFLIELNNRFKKVNSRFKEMSTEGFNTDRGRIYIINGEPNSIRTEHNPNSNNIREIWNYKSGNVYIFEENSFGRFYLLNGGF